MLKSIIRRLIIIVSLNLVVMLSINCNKMNLAAGDANCYVPTATDATSSASLSDLQNGRSLFVGNCGACHSLYSPDSYSPSQWRSSILPVMTPRTNLNSSQVSLVAKYVTRGH